MIVPHLIERKRDGGALAAHEWGQLVSGYTSHQIPDYQMAALLMAVYFRGLTPAELEALTGAMLESGGRMGRHGGPPRIDKHSTGGVGDKVSLVLAPLVAACGVAVPMISGRGLGHTGGTLDKLESIPGFRTDLSLREADDQMARLGCVMIGQSAEIAPVDRRLYALRDVTATVAATPLIAASIMSKKLAENLDGLVLDIKRGSGAFVPGLAEGLDLAKVMVQLGTARGCPTVALLTAMDRPLGRACGSALEMEEALLALAGEGPGDLMEVTYALGAEMMMLAGAADDAGEATASLKQALVSGRAADRFRDVILAQGGNPEVVDDPALLPQAPVVRVFEAAGTGHVARIEPRILGQAIVAMGGGRVAVDAAIQPGVGFVISAQPGQRVVAGQPLASVHATDERGARIGAEALRRAIEVTETEPERPLPLVSYRVTAAGAEAFG